MNAHTPRQAPLEGEQDAQLLSRTARDLPAGRHQLHKERLMARIQQEQRETTTVPDGGRRFRLPRPAVTLPLMAAALAGVVVVGVLKDDGEGVRDGGAATAALPTVEIGTATTKGMPQLLDRISLAAAKAPHPSVRPGQYVYIESKAADTYLKRVEDEVTLGNHALHRRQVWKSSDGTKGWLIDPSVNDAPEGETLSGTDEKGNVPVAGLNNPSYDYLADLTTDPDQLLALIYKETKGQGNSPDQQAFTTIGDLLGESYPPAKLYPALFKAAEKIPDVVVVPKAVDAVGREGVAVARLDEVSGEREEWIFDKKTHVFLGSRTVQVGERPEDEGLIKPGQVTHTHAVLKRAVVDGVKQIPSTD
ncbi:CU044_5270 family protein [Streptomyces sp. NPDC005955]|uniref:CU044_5270 family protein n=1 Tax=Streptomyces sp. NPDC005955 TaxID=3364738 RepID=UPI0036AF81C0